MVILNKRSCLIVMIFFALLSCSPQNEFYIVNFSDENLKVSLTPIDGDANVQICFLTKVVSKPSSGDYQKCKQDQIQPTPEKGSVSFELSAHQTVFLGTSSIGRVLFSKLVLESKNNQTLITSENYQYYFKTHDSLYANMAHTLYFKP